MKYIDIFIDDNKHDFSVGHWIGTQDFQYITENWADEFRYTTEGLSNLDYYRKRRSSMTDEEFDLLCEIIAAYANNYIDELDIKFIDKSNA